MREGPLTALSHRLYALLVGIITKQDEVECVCSEIRQAAGKVRNNLLSSDEGEEGPARSLSDLQLGSILAKGCNAVVFAAKWADRGWRGVSRAFERIEGPEEATTSEGQDFSLAVKMMFNYEAESNATAIVEAMQR